MRQEEFIARTQQGKTFPIIAENTENEIKSTYPVKNRPVNGQMTFCVVLDREAAKEVLDLTLPGNFKECGVALVDQKGWREFTQECARERFEREDTRLEILFPGLQEIKDARQATDYYDEMFERAMENENTVVYPTPPEVSVKEVCAKYPKAAAYLHAKGYAQSTHVTKSTLGQQAVKSFEAGTADYTEIITEMEAQWSEYCRDHAWD